MARKKKAEVVDPETRAKMRKLVDHARAGDLDWFDREIRHSGYGDPPGDEILVTSRQLEDGLQLSRRQITNYVAEGMPRNQKAYGSRAALFDLWAVIRWLRGYWKRIHAGGLYEPEAAKWERMQREADLMKKRAEAEMKAKEAGLKAGRLVERDKVENDINHILLTFQTRLESLPADIAAEGVGKPMGEIADHARRRITEIWNAAVDEVRAALPPKPAEPQLFFEREKGGS